MPPRRGELAQRRRTHRSEVRGRAGQRHHREARGAPRPARQAHEPGGEVAGGPARARLHLAGATMRIRLTGRRLAPGRYRIRVRATDRVGNASKRAVAARTLR